MSLESIELKVDVALREEVNDVDVMEASRRRRGGASQAAAAASLD